jgi:hypothetical protein
MNNNELGMWALIGLALLFANGPFFYRRLFLFYSLKAKKSFVLHIVELASAYILVGLFGRWLEGVQGQIAPQNWEFYATTATLFLTLAFPGFVYRFLYKRGH